MPSKSFLQMTLHSSTKIGNAFWLSQDEPLTFKELQEVTKNFDEQLNLMYRMVKTDHEIDEFIKHYGYTVSSFIDSKVPKLDSRMIEITELKKEYRNSDDDIDIARELTNKSLGLSYDIQNETQKLMRELGVSGTPINSDIFDGPEDLKEVFVKYSSLFPSSWNNAMEGKIRVIKLLKEESWKFDKSKFLFTKNENNSSFNHNAIGGKKDLFKITYGQDGHLAYPSLEKAIYDAKKLPLEFHTKHEVVHEMTHMYERNDSRLNEITFNFLKSRAIPKQNGFETDPLYNDESQTLYVDHFPNRLCGIRYTEGGRTEILSRGTESILLGTNGSFIGLPALSPKNNFVKTPAPDIDYRNLMLGILFGYKK